MSKKPVSLINAVLFAFVFFSISAFIPSYTYAFVFISAADTKTGVSTLTAISNRIVSLYPSAKLWIYPGDLQNKGFDPATINTWINAVNGGNNNGMYSKIFPTRGNHDANNNYFPNAAADWTAFFGSGSNSLSTKVSAMGGSNYRTMSGQENRTYSFDYDNSHFIGVDSWGSGDATVIDSSMQSWIDQDLTAAEGRGKIHSFLFWHGPLYTVDGHSASVNSGLVSVLTKHPSVTATFHGHEHVDAYVYIDGSRISAFANRPIHEFVIGNAGAGNYSCSSGKSNYCDTYSGFGALDVSGNTITAKLYDVQGTLKYTKTFTHGANITPPPTSNTPTPPPGCTKPGDANCDGKVDGFDYVTWWQNFGKNVTGGSTKGDFNNSGFVDGFDYVIWWQNFGK